MKKRSIIVIFLSIFSLIIIFLALQNSSYSYKFHRNIDIPLNYKDTLLNMANTAIDSGDYPVSCLILYKNEIIAKGFNTVYNDIDPCGHAEINALKKVFKEYGTKGFDALNKDSLVIISTYEPCLMCKGTFAHYRIENVWFLSSKTLGTKKDYKKRQINLNRNLRKVKKMDIQDSLYILYKKKYLIEQK